MVSLEQWRAAIGCFASCKNCKIEKYESVVSYLKCEADRMNYGGMICVIVYASIMGMLLTVSGDVKLNPGPFKECPRCKNYY